jgi:DNA-binding MarR family transcriptional regulator
VKDLLIHINKVFENKVRLGIMSILMVNDYVDFNRLKDLLGITDGNLASNIKSLEKNNYITISKEFLDKKPHTTYRISDTGRNSFIKHIEAMEKIIKSYK